MKHEHIPQLLKLGQDATGIIWGKLVKLYPKLDKYKEPTIKINNRFKSTGGVCKCDVRIIELSAEMFFYNQKEYCLEIIPHEVIHQVDYDLTGNVGHGKTWKTIMQAYGLKGDRLHTLINPMQVKRIKARK